MQPATIQTREDFLISLVTNTLASPQSKRAYEHDLHEFFEWKGSRPFDKAVVYEYREKLTLSLLAAASINRALSAIRKLAAEAADANLLDRETAAAILAVDNIPTRGDRVGVWLSLDQCADLLHQVDVSTLRGRRDAAILALLLGTGLRRQELSKLQRSHLQHIEGRLVILDLFGKGNRVRTVPVPEWAAKYVNLWLQDRPSDQCARVLVGIDKSGKMANSLSAEAIRAIVERYGAMIGLNIAPHDLRRTFAQRGREAGAELEQLQMSLGHANIATTQRYLGTKQNLAKAPCDLWEI